MGAILGQDGSLTKRQKSFTESELGCPGCKGLGDPATIATAAATVYSLGSRIFGGSGLSRSEKRNRRDQALNKLYSMGMDRAIVMNHSDHWAVGTELAELAEQYGDPVIKAINEVVPQTGGKLWSRNDSTYGQFDRILARANELLADQQSQPSTGNSGGSGVPATQAGFASNLTHPFVIGSGVIAAGTAAYLIMSDKK